MPIKIKTMLLSAALMLPNQLFAVDSLNSDQNTSPLLQCNIKVTGNPLDLAVLGDGFFVVSSGEDDRSRYFARYGRMYLDEEHYIRTAYSEDFLLGQTNPTTPDSLKKIHVPTDNLPGKVTKKIDLSLYLPSFSPQGVPQTVYLEVYGETIRTYPIELKLTKITESQWTVQTIFNNEVLAQGFLTFDFYGALIKQEGLDYISRPDAPNSRTFELDFKGSIGNASEFRIKSMSNDGFSYGKFVGMDVNPSGHIVLYYTNSQTKTLKPQIVLAHFTNPSHLDYVSEYVYKQSKHSGAPKISPPEDTRLASRVLEVQPCPL